MKSPEQKSALHMPLRPLRTCLLLSLELLAKFYWTCEFVHQHWDLAVLQVAKYFYEMPDLRGSVWSIPTKPREIQNVSSFQCFHAWCILVIGTFDRAWQLNQLHQYTPPPPFGLREKKKTKTYLHLCIVFQVALHLGDVVTALQDLLCHGLFCFFVSFQTDWW